MKEKRAVKMWDHYIVYAISLGVAKKVLKEFKKAHLINENYYNVYTGIYVSSGSFATSAGVSGGAGGAGGGGGGGR